VLRRLCQLAVLLPAAVLGPADSVSWSQVLITTYHVAACSKESSPLGLVWAQRPTDGSISLGASSYSRGRGRSFCVWDEHRHALYRGLGLHPDRAQRHGEGAGWLPDLGAKGCCRRRRGEPQGYTGMPGSVLCGYTRLSLVQTSMENEESIYDVVEAVRKTVEMLAPSVPILPPTVSPELKARILAHIS
jgi:hypothetical protein